MAAAVSDPRIPGYTITQWANALLTKMFGANGLTSTARAADVGALVTWANTESSGYNPNASGGRFNPLNTTEGALGYTGQGGSQGNIKDFGSFDQGVANQAYNLVHTKRAGYEPIVAALRAGDTPGMYAAVDASSFGTHGLGKGGTPAGPTGSSTGTSGASLTGIDLNPLNWWGDIVGGVQGGIANVVITGIVLAGGVGLIVLGAWRSVAPDTRQAITGTVTTAATAAAAA